MPNAELVTIPNIQLVETGIDWPASTGNVTFTEAHLRAAAEAPYLDPAVKLPRLRFGHTSAGTPIMESMGGFNEQPCVGKFINLRVEDEGNTLVADLAGVPKWLAEILPTAYPSRSVEAWFDVTSVSTQKTHDMIITSVALLGEHLPGVQTLDDLQLLFSDDPGMEWIEGLTAKTMVAASHTTEGGEPLPTRVAASVDTGDVRSAFYEQVAVDENYWWWLHQLYLEPSVCIAEDDYGDYWLCPYTFASDGVEFDEPVQVFIQWVEKESGKVAASLAGSQTFGRPDTQYSVAADSRPPERQQEYNVKHNKEAKGTVPIDIPALRERLSLSETDLPDDATEEQINEALSAPAPEPAPESESVPDDPEAVPVAATSKFKLPPGTKLVSAELFDEMTSDLSELKKDKTDGVEKANIAEVDQAIRDRKLPRSARASWVEMMKANPESTKETIKALEKNAVPGPPIGTDEDLSNPEQPGSRHAATRGTGLFPELERERARRAA